MSHRTLSSRNPFAANRLEAEHVTDPVPVARDDLERDILAAERALEPVPPEAILDSIERLLDAVNPPSQSSRPDEIAVDLAAWWSRNHEIYVAALADLPADLLKAGSVAALRHCHLMPKPADIRRPVEDELARRRRALIRLRAAAAPTVKRVPLTAEQEVRLARLLGRPRPQVPAGEAA